MKEPDDIEKKAQAQVDKALAEVPVDFQRRVLRQFLPSP